MNPWKLFFILPVYLAPWKKILLYKISAFQYLPTSPWIGRHTTEKKKKKGSVSRCPQSFHKLEPKSQIFWEEEREKGKQRPGPEGQSRNQIQAGKALTTGRPKGCSRTVFFRLPQSLAKKQTDAAERLSPTAGHLGSVTDSPAPVCVACRTHRKLGREYLAEQEKNLRIFFLWGEGPWTTTSYTTDRNGTFVADTPDLNFVSHFGWCFWSLLTNWADKSLCSLAFPVILLHLVFAPGNTKEFLFLTT